MYFVLTMIIYSWQ